MKNVFLIGLLGFVATAALSLPPAPAAAVPADFPDVGNYTPVDPEPLINAVKNARTIIFYPATRRYSCAYLMESPSGAGVPYCQGDIPGLTDASAGQPGTDPTTAGCHSTLVKPGAVSREPSACGPYRDAYLDLPGHELLPGQKVSYGPVTCVQDGGDSTACVDGSHGFVISPQRTWAF